MTDQKIKIKKFAIKLRNFFNAYHLPVPSGSKVKKKLNLEAFSVMKNANDNCSLKKKKY